MGRFFRAVKATVRAMGEAPQGERFTVMDKTVVCTHCAHDHFAEGQAQLNTAGMTFLKLDWANSSAATLMCTRCGHIEWFMETPDVAD